MVIGSLLSLSSFNANAEQLKDFSLPIFNSEQTFSLKQERSKGLVVLNFWATWCTACIKEIPELEALKSKYAKKAQFFAVNAGDKASYIKRFTKRHGFSYTVLHDADKSFSKDIGVLELPRTMVIDQTGKIIYNSNRPPKSL